jgi:hypothetical protein
MDVLRELMKKPRQTESLAILFFVFAVLYTVFKGTTKTILLGIGFTLIVLGALPRQVALAFLVGASVILLVQTSRPGLSGLEGFADKEEEKEEPEPEVKEVKETEAFMDKIKKKPLVPDHTDRKEPLELGKGYKMPNENDDKGYHLDSGTTFLNAYKALKPDQIAAMTRDTQELLATQKALVGMLDSFGPLMKDMNKITGFFGPTQ